MKCYYCDAKPVLEDSQGYVYVHHKQCPVLEREVKAMVEDKTPMSIKETIDKINVRLNKAFCSETHKGSATASPCVHGYTYGCPKVTV